MQEASADNAPDSKASLPWHRTVVGKVAIFMLMGVIFAYLMGAMLGFTMVERSARDQWGARSANECTDGQCHYSAYLYFCCGAYRSWRASDAAGIDTPDWR